MSAQNDRQTEKPPAPSRRRWLGYFLAGLVGALLGGATLTSVSNAELGRSWHGHFRRAHWGPSRSAAFDGGMVRESAARRVDYLLYELEATSEQREQVRSIVNQAFDELAVVRDQHRASRAAFLDALSQAEVDRDALEALRAEQLRLAEDASRGIVRAAADAAELLTPEQRARLHEFVGRFGSSRF